MFPRLDVEIVDTPFDPDAQERVVQVRTTTDGQQLYRVFIYLTGRDLPFVRSVTYQLPSAIADPPVRTVVRSPAARDCRIDLWVRGSFEIRAVVEDLKDGTHELEHLLQFGQYFDEKRFNAEGLKLRMA